jgi:hypothetical protein
MFTPYKFNAELTCMQEDVNVAITDDDSDNDNGNIFTIASSEQIMT